MAGSPAIDWRTFRRGLIPCLGCGYANQFESAEQPLSVFSCGRCQAPVIHPLRIRDYWLFQPLGGGGMGSVYKAIQEQTGREFAVKVLSREGRRNPDFIQAMVREATAGQAIGSHPNLVAHLECGEENGEYFIVSEFASGDRLDQLIEHHGPLPERTAVAICRQLLEAEMHICQHGYLFRDMKPENVLYVLETQEVRLLDFGLCLPLAEMAAGHNVGDELEGSPFYLPPERIVGAPEGEYSEVYSLGMLLFFMLTGRTYYSQADIETLVTKHVSSLRVSSVSNRLQHCNAGLVLVLDRMIARNPNQRYPNLASLRQSLDQVFAGLRHTAPLTVAAAAPEPAPAPAVKTSARQNRTAVFVILALLAAVLLFAGFKAISYRLKLARVQVQLREETAKALGVTAEVQAPTKSVEQVEALVQQRAAVKFAEQAHAIPEFDAVATTKAICDGLGFGALQGRPTKTIAQLDAELARAEQAAVSAEVAKRGAGFVEAEVQAQLARELGFAAPPSPPAASLAAAEQALRAELVRLVEQECPASRQSAQIAQALAENRTFRVGETITLHDRLALPVTGVYHGREGALVVVGERKLPLIELPAAEQARFDENRAQEKVAEAVAKVREEFRRERLACGQRLQPLHEAEFMKSQGFVRVGSQWRAAAEVIAERLALARTAAVQRLQTVASAVRVDRGKATASRDQVLRKNGYRLVADAWLTQDEAVAQLLPQRRAEFLQQRQTQLARLFEDIGREEREVLFREHGYTWVNGRWQEARGILDQLVARDLERRMAMP